MVAVGCAVAVAVGGAVSVAGGTAVSVAGGGAVAVEDTVALGGGEVGSTVGVAEGASGCSVGVLLGATVGLATDVAVTERGGVGVLIGVVVFELLLPQPNNPTSRASAIATPRRGPPMSVRS
jgi:hypothetical protein